jgi:hypothetical protein
MLMLIPSASVSDVLHDVDAVASNLDECLLRHAAVTVQPVPATTGRQPKCGQAGIGGRGRMTAWVQQLAVVVVGHAGAGSTRWKGWADYWTSS